MKQLTQERRNKIYKDAIPQLAIECKLKGDYGICSVINEISGYNEGLVPCVYTYREDYFPEFNLFFDGDGDAYFCEKESNDYLIKDLSREEFLKIREIVLMLCVEMSN